VSLLQGDQMDELRLAMTDIMRTWGASHEDSMTWFHFQQAIDSAKEWETGNGQYLVPERSKLKLRNSYNAFFHSYTSNPTFAGTVTPYIHILCSHVPDLMDKNKNLQRFSQQGVEHWMEILQRLFISNTDHRDSMSLNVEDGLGFQPSIGIRSWRIIHK